MKTSPSDQEPTHEEIALSAFLTWEKEGRQPGRESSYWLRAEAEIRSLRQKKAETAAAQTAKRWPSAPAAARSSTATTAAKATAPGATKLATKVDRVTAAKATLPSRSVSMRKTAPKPSR